MPSSNQPQITESSILASYLLTPSPLPTALPYSTFLSTCVPAIHRSHPHVKRLYRDLQFQRNIDVDAVRENIERECARSGVLKGQLAGQIQREKSQVRAGKKRKRSSGGRDESGNLDVKMEDDEDEMGTAMDKKIETAMFNTSAHPASEVQNVVQVSALNGSTHRSSSLLLGMKEAIASLEHEVDELTLQNATLLAEMTETIGQLSDLRYGRFAKPSGVSEQETVENGIIEALRELRGAMAKVTGD